MKDIKKEQKKISTQLSPESEASSIIFIILNIFLGVFIFCFAVSFFYYKAYLEGILFTLLAVSAFLPKKIIKISQGKKFLIILLILVISSMLSILFSVPLPEKIINQNMQEKFIVGGWFPNISLIIHNATKSALVDGETTNGYFISIDCRLTNLGTSPLIFQRNSLVVWYSLTDNQNETFRGKFSGIEQTFQPDLETKCSFLFEIPKTAEGLKLHIKDLASGETNVVDLEM